MTAQASGWGEYQKLVLAELERHNKWLNSIDEKLNTTLLTFTLEKRAIESLAKLVEQLDTRVAALEEDHTARAAVDSVNAVRDNSRKWLIGLMATTLFSVAAMALNIIATNGK